MKTTRFNASGPLLTISALILILSMLSVHADGRVRGWGGDGICDTRPCPTDMSWISNVVAVAAGNYLSLALKADGHVIAWGANADTNFPSGLSNIVAVAAYADSCMALRANGRVVVWGYDQTTPTNIPSGLHDVAAISAGGKACVVVQSNGTIVAWGLAGSTLLSVPSGLSNVVAVSAGAYHALALQTDGTVVAWPDRNALYSPWWNNRYYGQVDVPPGLTNVVAIAAGKFHSLALKIDGTVAAWGGDADIHAPANLSNVVAIAAGDSSCLALKGDGTVVEWISTLDWVNIGQYTVPRDLSNVVAISSSLTHNLALYSAEPIFRIQPGSRSVIAGETVLFSVSATSPGPMTYHWRFSGTNILEATNVTFAVTNAQAPDTGPYDVVICNSYVCVTSRVAILSFKVAEVQMMAAVTVQGEVGSKTRVEWSSDLNTWNTLTNFTLPNSPFKFADWDSLGQPRRFYRVVFEP